MYTEYFMYPPIFEVASSRKWNIQPQFPFNYGDGWKFVDFVFYKTTGKAKHGSEVAAMELSYIKKGSKTDKISTDQSKLRRLNSDDFQNGSYGTMKRYVMMAGQEDDLKKYCATKLKTAAKLLGSEETAQGGWIYRSPMKLRVKTGNGSQSSHWCVMVLSVQRRESRSGRTNVTRVR
jgi:hypothetical protein